MLYVTPATLALPVGRRLVCEFCVTLCATSHCSSSSSAAHRSLWVCCGTGVPGVGVVVDPMGCSSSTPTDATRPREPSVEDASLPVVTRPADAETEQQAGDTGANEVTPAAAVDETPSSARVDDSEVWRRCRARG